MGCFLEKCTHIHKILHSRIDHCWGSKAAVCFLFSPFLSGSEVLFHFGMLHVFRGKIDV